MTAPAGPTTVDVQKVAAWLEKHWKDNGECPICGVNRWQIGNSILEVRQFHQGGLVLDGPVYPLVSVTCMNCGHTVFFNAVVMGLVAAEKEAPQERAAGAQS